MDPNITAPATKLMMDVVVNTFSRNKCRGKIGSAARCSAQIKTPVDTMAVASNPNAIRTKAAKQCQAGQGQRQCHSPQPINRMFDAIAAWRKAHGKPNHGQNAKG